MLRGVLLVVCVLLLLTFAATFAQQSSEVGTANLYRYGELLQQHHIELTKSALLRALKNSDEAVRYLAAMKQRTNRLTPFLQLRRRSQLKEFFGIESISRLRLGCSATKPDPPN